MGKWIWANVSYRRRSGRHINGRATVLLQLLASLRRRESDADVWEQSRSCFPDDGYTIIIIIIIRIIIIIIIMAEMAVV